MKYIKIIILCCIIFIVACKKVAPVPTIDDTNNSSQNIISDGQSVSFILRYSGTYTLTLMDTIQNQVLTREQFSGKVGLNQLNIYTKVLQSKYLYLILEDSAKTQMRKIALTTN